MTFSFAEKLAKPALFSARQVYVPACSSVTESIASMLILFPTLDTLIPFLYLTLTLLCSHENCMGKSPLCIEHAKDTESPKLIILSPNSKGVICGKTERKKERNKKIKYPTKI